VNSRLVIAIQLVEVGFVKERYGFVSESVLRLPLCVVKSEDDDGGGVDATRKT